LANSSNVQPKQQMRVVTADVYPNAEASAPTRQTGDVVAQHAPPQGQFVETFNSQMDRLRAEMKSSSGQAEVSESRKRGFAVEFPEIPKFDESVAPNETIDLAHPLNAPEIAVRKAPEFPAEEAAPVHEPQPSLEPSVRAEVRAEPSGLPLIRPRKPVQRPSQQPSPSAA
jgi:hypothetical protein